MNYLLSSCFVRCKKEEKEEEKRKLNSSYFKKGVIKILIH